MTFAGYIYLVDGWDKVNDKWTYADKSGNPVTGWQEINGIHYYFYDNAIMATGWINVNGEYYYLDSEGAMQTGWQKINGEYYYLDSEGAMHKGWLEDGGNTYHMNMDGVMDTGWQNIDGDKYYFLSDGKMLKNVCKVIDGVDYQFNNNGIATRNYNNNITNPADKYSPDISIERPEYKDNNKTTESPTEESTPEYNEKHIQYRYRTKKISNEYTVSTDPNLIGWELIETIDNGKWGKWSNWSDEYIDETDNVQVEERTIDSGTKTQIFLGRYYSEVHKLFSDHKIDQTYVFEGGWFDEDSVRFVGQWFAGGRKDCWDVDGYTADYPFFEIGEHGGERREVSTGQKTQYRYREKSKDVQYKYCRPKEEWSNWTEWGDTPIEENDMREVQTQFV